MYVPNIPKVKLLILDEIHKTPYSGHLGYQKTITMLRKEYFWPNMKTEVAEYIVRCLECQQVKLNTNTQLVCYSHYPSLAGNWR